MKNKKTQQAINALWQEHLESRSGLPTAQDFLEMAEKGTNLYMYKEIKEIYTANNALEFDVINKVFRLQYRTDCDLKNLSEAIIGITLILGQDVLVAKILNDKVRESAEKAKHDARCSLMLMLLEAIDSELFSR